MSLGTRCRRSFGIRGPRLLKPLPQCQPSLSRGSHAPCAGTETDTTDPWRCWWRTPLIAAKAPSAGVEGESLALRGPTFLKHSLSQATRPQVQSGPRLLGSNLTCQEILGQTLYQSPSHFLGKPITRHIPGLTLWKKPLFCPRASTSRMRVGRGTPFSRYLFAMSLVVKVNLPSWYSE